MIRIACHVQDYYFEIIKKYFAAKDYYLEKDIYNKSKELLELLKNIKSIAVLRKAYTFIKYLT